MQRSGILVTPTDAAHEEKPHASTPASDAEPATGAPVTGEYYIGENGNGSSPVVVPLADQISRSLNGNGNGNGESRSNGNGRVSVPVAGAEMLVSVMSATPATLAAAEVEEGLLSETPRQIPVVIMSPFDAQIPSSADVTPRVSSTLPFAAGIATDSVPVRSAAAASPTAAQHSSTESSPGSGPRNVGKPHPPLLDMTRRFRPSFTVRCSLFRHTLFDRFEGAYPLHARYHRQF